MFQEGSQEFFLFQLREEIENEFTEKMELLRNMYVSELKSQVKSLSF